MSGGPEDASAMGRLDTKLREAAYQLRDAIVAAEEGHRGWAIDVQAANEILLPSGWKIVRADRVTVYR